MQGVPGTMVSTNRPGVASGSGKSVKERRLEKRKAAREEAFRQRINKDQILVEFQPDAVELEKSSIPGGARWTLYTCIALICAAVSWSYWAKVDKIVTANGKLVTIEPAVVIQTSLASPIRSMNVKFGDVVQAGDVLATLDPTFPEADLAALRSQLETLDASLARLTAERNGKPFSIDGQETNQPLMMQYQAYLERKNEYRAKMNEFVSEARKLDVQSKNNEAEIEVAKKDYATYKSLEEKYEALHEKGRVSAVDLLSRRIQTRQAKGKLVTLRSRSMELVSEKESLEKRREAFTASWRSQVVAELIKDFLQRSEILQQLNKAEKMSEFVDIRVPESEKYENFFVYEVADRTLGSVTQASEPLFKLIPVNAPMEVEVEVQGDDIGLIHVGSTVRVKLASFPYQKHGTLEGTVRAISEGSTEQKDQLGNVRTTYRAMIELDESIKLDNVSEHFRMMPGMTTIAEIKVGRRRVIQYFLYPLIRYWDESIREP